ncbi:MAG: helix-hairpin-helix domain-containing protein [Terrimesophilobacter sp.]
MPPADPLAASRSSRFRVGLGAAVVLVLVGIGITVLVATLGAGAGNHEYLSAPTPNAVPGTSGANATGSAQTRVGAEIYVHVLGAVQNPGLYVFREGDRAVDAVAAAGGYTDDADRRGLNLARFLSDGEQIVVPTQGETASGTSPNVAGTQTSSGRVNLNTADAAALETLPRVGPALAARILAWRDENGRFASVEDLLSVTGIGAKTFAGLKDLVTV